MNLKDTAPSRCILRGHSHRGQSCGTDRMLRELGLWRVMEKWGQGSEGLRKGEKVVISPESPQQEEGQ